MLEYRHVNMYEKYLILRKITPQWIFMLKFKKNRSYNVLIIL